jgi:hypothetical protein
VVKDLSDNKRYFLLNSGSSSSIDTKTKESFFEYIKEIKKHIIKDKSENVLIFGAA